MLKEIDKLAWLHIKNNTLLVARSKDKELFYLPGGKREQGESDEEALIREIKEEISVDIIPNSIKYADTFIAQADGKSADVSVKLTCYFAEFNGELQPDAEIEEIKYVNYQDLAQCSIASIVAMEWLKSNSLIS